jgi:hypothetical protein
MRPGSTKRAGSRAWPWFSSLKWWQKGLFALAAFVILLTLFLLPRNFSLDLVGSGLVSIFGLSYFSLKRWQRILLIVLSSAVLTALLLLTEHVAPYLLVVVGVLALVLSFTTGWRDAGPPPPDRSV